MHLTLFIVYLISSFVGYVSTKQLLLIPSSGCYSHDVMMKEVGKEFPDWNVTWLQIYMYNFGHGPVEIPRRWQNLSLMGDTLNGNKYIERGGRLMWETFIPFDTTAPWDFRGFHLIYGLLRRYQPACSALLEMDAFKEFMRTTKVDLIVIDHIFQECLVAIASLLNATTVRFSNWPISDLYISPFNIPSNPSSVAITTTASSNLSMGFLERVLNTLSYIWLYVMRAFQRYTIYNFFAPQGIENIDITEIESEHIFHAARSEMLFDTIRPINNRIKYFGCQTCRSPEQYRTIIPSDFLHWNSAENLQDAGGKNIVTQHEIVIRRNTNKTYWRCNTFSTSSIKEPQIRRHWNHSCIDKVDHLGLHVSRHTALIATDRKTDWLSITKKRRQNKCTLKEWLFEPIEMYRFRSMQKKFPTFDFGRLERSKFIIVSFGSIAKTEYMAFELLDSMLDTFSHLKYTVIWQTNCDHDKMLRGRSLPKNIIMSRWLPLKELFGHPNLMYFVSHGGINTINEILSFGVPIVGVPLQGDQSSNIQRIVELGVGNSVSVREIWNGRLPEVLANMENNLQRYRRRSKKVAVMLADQRKLTKGIQHFWLHWAERNGPKLKVKNRRFFDLKYRSSFDYFSGLQVLFSMGIFFGLLFVLSTSY